MISPSRDFGIPRREISQIPAYSSRWQNIMLLLHSLHELGNVQWKYDVTEFIEAGGKYQFVDSDFRPGCWSKTLNEFEPVWVTEIDRASRQCMQMGLLNTFESEDSWQISAMGTRTVRKLQGFANKGVFEVRRCYLWSKNFKQSLDPGYVPSKDDAKRPITFYDLIQRLSPRQMEAGVRSLRIAT